MIEEMKEPRANRELSALPLRHREPLLHIEVSVEGTWATKLITALGAKIIGWVSEIDCAVSGIG